MKAKTGLKTCVRVLALGCVGVAGLFFSPWGQEMQARTARGECPFPSGKKNMVSMNDATLGLAPAPSNAAAAYAKQAWGMTLGRTDQSAVLAWAQTHHATCKLRKSHVLECDAAEPEAVSTLWHLAQSLSLTFYFNSENILQAVGTQASFLTPDSAAEAMLALVTHTTEHVGGEPDSTMPIRAETLAQGPLSQMRVEYHRSDLFAAISATTLADQVTVQHTMRSL